MPRGDGTGPAGMGPMTGRGAGYCAGYAAPGFARPGFGRGMGMGFRRGRGGYRMQYMPPVYPDNPAPPAVDMTPEENVQMLKNQAAQLSQTLENINKQIAELEKSKE